MKINTALSNDLGATHIRVRASLYKGILLSAFDFLLLFFLEYIRNHKTQREKYI